METVIAKNSTKRSNILASLGSPSAIMPKVERKKDKIKSKEIVFFMEFNFLDSI